MLSPHLQAAAGAVCAGLALFLAVSSPGVSAQTAQAPLTHALIAVSSGSKLDLVQHPLPNGRDPHPNRMVCRRVLNVVGLAIGVDCERKS